MQRHELMDLLGRCLRRSLLIGHLQLCGRDGHDRSRPPYT